jgi:hypothetical protein
VSEKKKKRMEMQENGSLYLKNKIQGPNNSSMIDLL